MMKMMHLCNIDGSIKEIPHGQRTWLVLKFHNLFENIWYHYVRYEVKKMSLLEVIHYQKSSIIFHVRWDPPSIVVNVLKATFFNPSPIKGWKVWEEIQFIEFENVCFWFLPRGVEEFISFSRCASCTNWTWCNIAVTVENELLRNVEGLPKKSLSPIQQIHFLDKEI